MTSKPALQRILEGAVHIEEEDKHIQGATRSIHYQASVNGGKQEETEGASEGLAK